MRYLFKLLIIVLPLFLTASRINAQDRDSGFSEIDSLQQTLSIQIDKEIKGLQTQFINKQNQLLITIDSLNNELNSREMQINNLIWEQKKLEKQIQENKMKISGVENIVLEAKQGYKRFFFIAGPSFLFLILASVLIYFYLMMKQQEETERKISALKRYAHNEIEGSRDDLLRKLKKRIKKIGSSLDSSTKKSKKPAKKK